LAAETEAKKPLKITQDFFKDKDFDETRRHFLSCYGTNGQNHVNYLLTIALAILAFIAGWEALFTGLGVSTDTIIRVLLFSFVFVALSLLVGWLTLRSKYWSIWNNYALILTEKKVAEKFTEINLRRNIYFEGEVPPCEAVLHYAVEKAIIDYQRELKKPELKWSLGALNRKLAIMTGRLK
jgi:hypothetical protein